MSLEAGPPPGPVDSRPNVLGRDSQLLVRAAGAHSVEGGLPPARQLGWAVHDVWSEVADPNEVQLWTQRVAMVTEFAQKTNTPEAWRLAARTAAILLEIARTFETAAQTRHLKLPSTHPVEEARCTVSAISCDEAPTDVRLREEAADQTLDATSATAWNNLHQKGVETMHFRRRAPREPDTRVGRCRIDDEHRWWPCQLTDISAAGAGIEAMEAPSALEGRRISITTDEKGVMRVLRGEIRQVRRNADGNVRIGLEFDEETKAEQKHLESLTDLGARW